MYLTHPMMETAWSLLPGVSRSFAFVTRALADGVTTRLGEAVCVFYLVCRVLDTVEDSGLPQVEKRRLYDRFLSTLEDGERAPLPIDPHALTEHAGYQALLSSVPEVIAAFASFDRRAQAIVRRYAGEMARGMDDFGGRSIVTFADLDAYCHPVAVVVGYGLTELFSHYGHLPGVDPTSYVLARRFGLLLQKVNITRDYGMDHAQGRHFWPRQILAAQGLDYAGVVTRASGPAAMRALDAMIAAIRDDTEPSLGYILRIPPREKALRMFCAVSLFLALLTLARVRGNPDVFREDPAGELAPGSSLKVPRDELLALVADLAREVDDDAALARRFHATYVRTYPNAASLSKRAGRSEASAWSAIG